MHIRSPDRITPVFSTATATVEQRTRQRIHGPVSFSHLAQLSTYPAPPQPVTTSCQIRGPSRRGYMLPLPITTYTPTAKRSQTGSYDQPPATSTSESSTPRTRRNRLSSALRATEDMAASDLAEMGASTRSSPARAPRFALQRRRQRSPGLEARDTGSDDSTRRRVKRRRLDTEAPTPPKQPIRYGHYGQVEPGRLKLEIISCDGGEHRDPRSPTTYLGSQNILRHDKSVYCSDRPTSGIVLRHADDTPFCLEKLHVVGPEHGFTAPYCLSFSS